MLHACGHESFAASDDVGAAVAVRAEAEDRGAEAALVGRGLPVVLLLPLLSREPTRTRPMTMRATEVVRIAGPQSKSRGSPPARLGRCRGFQGGFCGGLRAGGGSEGEDPLLGRRGGFEAGSGSAGCESPVGAAQSAWGAAQSG